MKFSTVVNTSGFAMLVEGKAIALGKSAQRALCRLQRASGEDVRIGECSLETLPRTGDNIRMRVTWQQHART